MLMDVQGWKERRGQGRESGCTEGTEKQLKRARVMAGRRARERHKRTMMSTEQVTLCQPLHHEQQQTTKMAQCVIPPYCVPRDCNLPIYRIAQNYGRVKL